MPAAASGPGGVENTPGIPDPYTEPGATSCRLPTGTVTGNGSYQCSPQAMAWVPNFSSVPGQGRRRV